MTVEVKQGENEASHLIAAYLPEAGIADKFKIEIWAGLIETSCDLSYATPPFRCNCKRIYTMKSG